MSLTLLFALPFDYDEQPANAIGAGERGGGEDQGNGAVLGQRGGDAEQRINGSLHYDGEGEADQDVDDHLSGEACGR